MKAWYRLTIRRTPAPSSRVEVGLVVAIVWPSEDGIPRCRLANCEDSGTGSSLPLGSPWHCGHPFPRMARASGGTGQEGC